MGLTGPSDVTGRKINEKTYKIKLDLFEVFRELGKAQAILEYKINLGAGSKDLEIINCIDLINSIERSLREGLK